MISHDKSFTSSEISLEQSNGVCFSPQELPNKRAGGYCFPNLALAAFKAVKSSEYAVFAVLICSLGSFPAFSQNLQNFKSFDEAVRDVKKTAVDFPSCFSIASFPVNVTTAFSSVVTVDASAVDSGVVNA